MISPEDIQQLQDKVVALTLENEKLKAQIHDMCHDLPVDGPLTVHDFCTGCENYQKQKFGYSPIADMRERLRALGESV